MLWLMSIEYFGNYKETVKANIEIIFTRYYFYSIQFCLYSTLTLVVNEVFLFGFFILIRSVAEFAFICFCF